MEIWGQPPLGRRAFSVQKQALGCLASGLPSFCGRVPSCGICSPAWEPPGLVGFGGRGVPRLWGAGGEQKALGAA